MPDTDKQVKRGRGRPGKPKTKETGDPKIKRPRGRPKGSVKRKIGVPKVISSPAKKSVPSLSEKAIKHEDSRKSVGGANKRASLKKSIGGANKRESFKKSIGGTAKRESSRKSGRKSQSNSSK